MANKYQLVNEMANETIKYISQSSENWIEFLNTASNNYKYSFSEQVLIYAQKANATACADIETWNKRLKRWVNKGAKGIALLSIENGRSVLRHVFDISDTHSGIGQDLKLWEVKPSYTNGIIETLENSFGNLEIKDTLAEAIYSSSINLVEDNFQDYLVDLKEVTEGSFLQELNDIELESYFRGILANSIAYMTMKRCGIDPMEHFSLADFEIIKQFNNKRVISRLGAATSDIAEREIREIYSSVINFEKNNKLTNRTFVNNEKMNYHNNEEKNSEGRNDYDRINIQTNGRLSDTTSSITKNKGNNTGEIFKNEGELPKRIQKRVIRGIDDRWQNGRTFRRNRTDSSKENETNNNKFSRKEPNNRENEKRESNGVGTSNELNKKPSRGNDNSRVNLQLNLFKDTYVPPIKELPSVEKQIDNIKTQAEVENAPAFSFTQEMIDKTLQDGTGHQNGKFRVYRLYQETLSSKERQDFLKKEFNYYGTNGVAGLDGIWVEYTPSKGLKLSKREVEDTMQVNWNTIEKRIGELIALDRYFINDEKEKYQNWLENDYENEKWMFNQVFKDENVNENDKIEIQNIDKNYKLKNGNYFHFHTNEEGYYYAIYDNRGTEIDGGLLEYSQNTDKENLDDIMPDWVYLDRDENNIAMNKYFVDNPEMILGKMEIVSTAYGYDSTCKTEEDTNLEEQLNYAITNIHGELQNNSIENEIEQEDTSIPAIPTVKNYSYAVIDDKLYFRENSKMILQDELPLTAQNRIKGLILLRDQTRELIDFQMEDYSDEEIHLAQVKLNNLYDRFTKEYGLINSRANETAFSNDSSYFLLCSLEKIDGEGKFVGKADIFSKRTIKAKKKILQVDTPDEALILSIQDKAKVDLNYMQKLCGIDTDKMIKSLEGVIFKVPEYGEPNNWVTADEYLSGNVREKLKIAEQFAKEDSSFNINVEKLKEVIPKDLTASEIGIKLGSTWIPPEIIRKFIFELLDTPSYNRWDIHVKYSNITAEWYIDGKSNDKNNVKAYTTYGTSRINAYKIIEQTLNLKDVKIFDTFIDDEGRKQRVLNRKETAIACSKQDAIKEAFLNWVWEDPERRNDLVRLYNDKFNCIRPREYDGSHIDFVGMNPEIKLRKHQLNAVAHILYGNNTLLAHEVGAGKTFEMVAAAMESKRLSLCNKSLFVVPNHIIEQFASEFLQLYPSANILVATKKDFETKNRKKFCSRIATGEFDAVIIGHSQFERIPMSIERQITLLEEQINDITKGIASEKANKGENYTIKQMEKTRKSLENRLEKLHKEERKDDVVTFEELGVDKLFVDEAHNYKNLFLYSKMRNVGGIAQTEAQKSSDLFMKCRYLDEITGGKGTVFATGTPVSNSMAELYTMQRYLQYGELRRNDLEHFDNWASTFGETITAIELAPEGSGYRAKTRFAKFHNLPELISLFKEVADIQTAETLNLPTPEFENINVVVKPSEIQQEMVKALGERAEKIRSGAVDATEDNMLKITNEGRKLALDQRLINPLLPDSESSKVNSCCENIYRIWDENSEKKSTQLVFCDLSTPKDLKGYEKEEFTDIYNELKKKLIQKGIPPDEIAFIHEADNEVKKKELFSKVRKGQVRVLIGSTQKMGAGTNVQDKLIATHHLDCAWKPSDLTQRNGRMIRQGNENKKVYVYSYVTEKTFDSYMYQLVEQKQKFISQIMTSKTPARTMEDIDDKALTYGEIKALATGNPKILEKTSLDTDVAKLRLLKQEFMNQKYSLQDRIIKYFPEEIARLNNKIGAMEEDTIKLQEYTKPNADGFSPMKINGIIHTEKQEAGKSLLQSINDLKSMETREIGEYRGFKMEISFDSITRNIKLKLKNKFSYSIDLGTDINGNITRINNCLENVAKDIPHERDLLDNTYFQLENAKQEVQKEFPKEQELQEKLRKLEEINAELKINEDDHEMLGDEKEVKQDKSPDKNSPERC